LLEGSVRRQGNRARITVRLVKAADGFTLWSNTFDREVSDIFAVQQEIGHAVTRALNVRGVAKIAGQSTNQEAYTAYLQGKYFLRRSQNALGKAASYFEESIRHDDRYAPAWSGLGYVRMNQAASGYLPLDDGYRKAKEAVERALKLDPDMSEAYSTLGTIKMTHDFDWSGAQAAYQRALSTDVGDPRSVHGPVPAMLGAATLNRILGRWPDAIRFFNQALELDPLNESAYPSFGQALYYAGRYEEAITALRKGLEVSPETVNLHALLCRVYLAQSRSQDAFSEANLEQHPAFRLQALSLAHAALGHDKESQDALQELIAKFGGDAQYQIAEVYAFRGETDRAWAALERAYAARDPGLTELKGDPLLKNVEHDPRYVGLLKRTGLPL
jgi:tetratricopeptide (TPR) repeat protein